MAWFARNRSGLAVTGFFMMSVALRFISASQTHHPTGWDGYYYVMQVHSWLTYGYLQSPDFSLIYPFFAAISFFTNDFILVYQIGVAILSGLLIVTVFYSLKRRDVEFSLICIVCSYLLFSPLFTYFVLQFPKNVLGLIFLILFVDQLRHPVISSVRPFVFLLATLLTHRMTGGFALIIIAIHAIKTLPWKWIVAGGVVLILVSLLPGVLHVSDLMRFSDQFTLVPHWAPWSFYKIFPSTLSIWFRIDLVIISLLILLAVYFRSRSYWHIIAFACIFPFFLFEPGSSGHRFFLLAPIAFILTIPFEKIQLRYALIPVVALTVTSVFSVYSYKPASFDPPNNMYRSVTGRIATQYNPQQYPLVIAHQSLAEIIIFSTGFDALNWLPPKDMPTTHVLRLINGVNYLYFRQYLEERDFKQVRVISRDYFVAPEDVWQRFVFNARQSSDTILLGEIFNGRNPMEERPYYLTKGKISKQ